MTDVVDEGTLVPEEEPTTEIRAVEPAGEITPMTLMHAMVTGSQYTPESLDKMMDLYERIEAHSASKAFSLAITQFQSQVKPIVKRKEARSGSAVTLYAPLGDIAESIKHDLRECGLAYRFKIAHRDDGLIEVTCIVSHAQGHKEETTMVSGADDSGGSMNSIQRMGSTVTYLQRYTLIGALGLATADEDMDGRVMQDYITADQKKDLEARAKAVNVNMEKYLAYLKIETLDQLRAADYAKAEQAMKDQEKAHANRMQTRSAKPTTKKPASSGGKQEVNDEDQ